MDRLAELTLRYSRDLSALQAACRSRMTEIDQQLRNALQALAAAAPLVADYDRTRTDARAVRDKTIGQAVAACQDAQAQAERRRIDGLLDQQQQYVDADRDADDKKQALRRKAERAYRSRLDEIDRTVGLGQQPAERRKAFDEYQRALVAADEAWKRTLREDRDHQQANLHATLEREWRERDQAAERRASSLQAAEAVYQQTLKLAQDRFAAALSAVPEAAAVQADFDGRRDAARQHCRGREEALFQAFREAVKGAQVPGF